MSTVPKPRRIRPIARLAMCLVGIAGCGDHTSGGVGEIEVVLAADSFNVASQLGAALSQLPSRDQRTGPATVDAPGTIEGTLTVSLRVYIRRSPMDWVELTDGE
ncbi:MAG: hypothetical protein EXR92_01085 [Gemmatimonadetes bacterium]|nr:hypothetical protein [Gemmatimonadota bacterium]